MTNFKAKTIQEPMTPQHLKTGFTDKLASSKKQFQEFKDVK